MKTSKVLEVLEKPSYSTQHGTFFPFNVRLGNGDVGQYSSKAQGQSKVRPGMLINYEITNNQQQGNKIKLVQASPGVQHNPTMQGGGGGKKQGYQKEPFEERAIGMAMGYAKDLLIAKVFAGEKLEPQFRRVYKMMVDLKNEMATDKAPAPQQTPPNQFQQFSNQGGDPRDDDFPPLGFEEPPH